MDAAERIVDEMNEELADEQDAFDEYEFWSQKIAAERRQQGGGDGK